MSEVAISVRGLSKQYRVGAKEKQADTFFGAIKNVIASPFRNYRQIRNLTRNGADDETLFWALRQIDFEVKRGEALGIIGHNGAGKSTLLKILSKITDPTLGEIMIKGRVSALLEVGTGFHPELTGRENVYMNGTILGMTKKEIDRKFDEIVDFSGVEKHIDTPVKFYSSGMKVRLGFAVAAHLETEILIIDEVLAVGDAEFQKKCLGKMEDVAHQGRTVLFVSHNLEAVRSLCSGAILLNHGQIEMKGEVHQVINKYISRYKINQLKKTFDEATAPGNADIKLLEAEILKGEGPLTVEEEFRIRFTFSAVQPVEKISLSLVLWTISGNCIFNVATSATDLREGINYSELVIPANLLNDEVYFINLLFVNKSSTVLFKAYEVLTFEVLDTPRVGNWFGKWVGAVRPSLSFRIN